MTVRWAGAQRSRPGQTVPVDVPLEANDVAREMTRHGIDFKKFLAAYRCSENVSSRRWLRATGEVVPPPKVALVAEYGLSSMNTWVDTILTSISAQIEREHDELTGSALARRLETAKLIIDGSPIRENVAQDRLGYELSAWHVGIVLWSSSAEQGTGIREKTAHLLALATGRRPPLILSVTAATAWVWLGDERPIDIRLLRDAMTQASEGVLVLQRQFVMSTFIVAGAGPGLAGAAPVRPVPDVDEGVLDWAGDAVEQSPYLVDCQRY